MPLSIPQKTIVTDSHRFRTAICGRRFGKTHVAMRELAYYAREPLKEVWYVAPSYKMAKNIVWRKLKNKLTDLRWVNKVNETELSLLLKNGSNISLKGADNYDSLRGAGLDFLVLDEFADINPLAWYETLRPTLSDRQGKALFIGTPKGIGNWSYDIFQKAHDDANWQSFQYTTLDGGNVPQSEIDQARNDLDERTFRQEYMATFETYSGRIYYGFEREHNVVDDAPELGNEIHIGMDFNVNPMSAVVAVRKGSDLTIVDEIRIFSSNTEEMIEEIRDRYGYQRKIFVYPDPAGHQSRTEASKTNVIQLRNAGFIVKVRHSHTLVRDRINAVNSKLCSVNGLRSLKIARTAKYTIEGLERQVYKPGTMRPDKDSGYDHMMDALGYLVDFLFPITRDVDPDLLIPQRWGHSIAN